MKKFLFSQEMNPFGSEKSLSRLSTILVFLILLLSFVSACAFVFFKELNRWGPEELQRIAIEVPFIPISNDARENFESHNKKVQYIKEEITKLKGIAALKEISQKELKDMMVVLTGEKNTNFVMPTILEVTTASLKNFYGNKDLLSRVKVISPEVKFLDHGDWRIKFSIFEKSITLLSLLIGGFSLLCVVILVSLVTELALRANYSILETLMLMGAKDSYIASIFQSQVKKVATKGGVWGFLISLPTTCIFMFSLRLFELSKIGINEKFFILLGSLFCIPVIVVLTSILVSRFTVLLYLKKLDAC